MSSSRRECGFTEFLVDSLRLLRAECRELYARMCAALAPRIVRIRVGGDTVSLAFGASGVREVRGATPQIEIESDRRTILAVLDAESTLLDAVLADRLVLRGSCDDLLAFHEGLRLYVHGAVRAPSLPGLLREFRRGAESRGDR